MKKFFISMVVGIASFSVSPAQAAQEGTILKNYHGQDKNFTELSAYVSGAGHGYFFANQYADSIGQNKLYCQPANVDLTIESYNNILDHEIKVGKHKQSEHIEAILLEGLRRKYPCPWDKHNPDAPK
jgi:hypothetical protein